MKRTGDTRNGPIHLQPLAGRLDPDGALARNVLSVDFAPAPADLPIPVAKRSPQRRRKFPYDVFTPGVVLHRRSSAGRPEEDSPEHAVRVLAEPVCCAQQYRSRPRVQPLVGLEQIANLKRDLPSDILDLADPPQYTPEIPRHSDYFFPSFLPVIKKPHSNGEARTCKHGSNKHGSASPRKVHRAEPRREDVRALSSQRSPVPASGSQAANLDLLARSESVLCLRSCQDLCLGGSRSPRNGKYDNVRVKVQPTVRKVLSGKVASASPARIPRVFLETRNIPPIPISAVMFIPSAGTMPEQNDNTSTKRTAADSSASGTDRQPGEADEELRRTAYFRCLDQDGEEEHAEGGKGRFDFLSRIEDNIRKRMRGKYAAAPAVREGKQKRSEDAEGGSGGSCSSSVAAVGNVTFGQKDDANIILQ